ncbi:MAG: DNA primase [Lachnospiraceae bacterium]|nr:DNA primase [Lachnospiraceae bacterium]
MPYYPREVIDEVTNSTDIVSIIGEHVQLKKMGNEYVGLCPFHSEKSPSFHVSPIKKVYHCFGCDAAGSIYTFLTEIEHMTFSESVEYLADRAGITLPTTELTSEEKKKYDRLAELKSINHKAVNYFYHCLKKDPEQRGYKYLKDRGLTDDTIHSFGLGYSQVTRDGIYRYLKKEGFSDDIIKESGLVVFDGNGAYDKFYNRVMFPILDPRGKAIAFGGRVMGDGKPKYMNSPETALFSKKRNLFGLYQSRSSKRSGFILCEGYMDVISMHQAGFDNAVASLGTAFTEEQAMLLKSKRDNPTIYLAYDSDEAGIKAANRAIEICDYVGLKTRVVSMKPYKDPDEFIKNEGAEAFEKRIVDSEASVMFRIHTLEQKYNLNDPMDKSEFLMGASEYLAKLDGMTRETYEKTVSKKYNVSVQELHKAVVKAGERQEKIDINNQIKENRDNERRKLKEDVEDGIVKQERIILTWAANFPTLWNKMREVIDIDDFTNPMTRRIAEIYDEHIKNYGNINFVELIDSFPDVDKHSEISTIINQQIHYDDEDSDDDNIKIIAASACVTEAVRRVKKSSIDRKMNSDENQEPGFYQKMIKDRQMISKININVTKDDIN